MPEIESRWSIWAHYPLEVRPGTSDNDVFNQVFIAREYAMLDDLTDVSLVIDCGAYVGYSAAYFLSRWPVCRVVAMEPNRESYRKCVANLKPYRNASVHPFAVWSHGESVYISDARYRDGREWACQVSEQPPESDTIPVPSISLNQVAKADRISLLKMDIEGAEAVVFSAPDLSWIDRVDNLVIETHDDSSFGPGVSQLVADVMTSRGFLATHHGELTVYRRR